MKQGSSLLAGVLLAIFGGLSAAEARAPAADIQLPSETVGLRPSKLLGFEIANEKCAICHSADYIAYQPPRMNQTQWTAEVAKMHATYGAPIYAAEIRSVGVYLTAEYGEATSIDPADLSLETVVRTAQSAAAAPAPAAAGVAPVDVPVLLGKNACLGCHSLQQKIVGPAYRDVAAKYRSDPQALTKIETSIREGGSGKWGAVPMPPFPGLSESQLKALAEFVMAQ